MFFILPLPKTQAKVLPRLIIFLLELSDVKISKERPFILAFIVFLVAMTR